MQGIHTMAFNFGNLPKDVDYRFFLVLYALDSVHFSLSIIYLPVYFIVYDCINFGGYQ